MQNNVMAFPSCEWFSVCVGPQFVCRYVDHGQNNEWGFGLTFVAGFAADIHESELERVKAEWPDARVIQSRKSAKRRA
jgi:hypothetical protein